jgi:RimJ/RimL family protein N-acetyltransferase
LNIIGGESDNLLFGANEMDFTLEQEEQFIESMNSSTTSALFIGTVDGRIICAGSLSTPYRERISHRGDVAMSVLKEFWRFGVGTYLMHEIIEFAKKSGKLEILHLGVKADNLSAIKLYEKIGFREIGRVPKFFKINGKYYDEILMDFDITS